MEITNAIIEIIYHASNVLFPFFILFFVGGLIWDLTNRRADK